MKRNISLIFKFLNFYIAAALLTACTSDLDQYPHVEKSPQDVFNSVEGYKGAMAKIYGSYVMRGQEKGGGQDISTSTGEDYMRCYFNMQELGTDEAAMVWLESNNQSGLSYLSWNVNDPWVNDIYYRIYYAIALANEFIRNAGDDALSGFSAENQTEIRTMRAEARFLRALSYSHALDLFRDVPFVDENSPVGINLPPKYTAQQIFDFIVSELNAIATELPVEPEYPRVGRAAAYGLLARVLLNAETYGCGNHYDDCVTACKAVIGMGYDTLEPNYSRLFNADNHKRAQNKGEILFAFAVDNEQSVSWGSTTYIVCTQCHSSFGDKLGVGEQSWGMLRPRSQIQNLFTGADDDVRNKFFTTDREAKITDLGDDSQGYWYMKWSNLLDTGQAPKKTTEGVCTDLPILRLADIYLMMAECQLRGASNITAAEALEYVNKVRRRAYGLDQNVKDPDNDLTAIDLDFMIQERGREFLIEMQRRTDLVRFNLFTTADYLWDCKGGASYPDGHAVDKKYNRYPIPYAEQTANPNMKDAFADEGI